MADTAVSLGDILGRAIMMQAKATFMGKQSGEARGKTAVAGDIAIDSVAGSPIATILDSFPSLKKSIRRNPALLDMALSFLSKNGSNNNGSSSSQETTQTKFNL